MDFGTIFNESKKDLTVVYPKESKKGGFTKLDNIKNSIFLAGPCPRSDYRNSDWRENTYDILRNLCFDGYVLNPTNEWYDTDNADELLMQTQWEDEAMHKASAIVFYLDRTEKNPGFTSNVEIGYWLDQPNVFVCIPEGCTKNANRYIEIKCNERGITVYRTLEDCYAAVIKQLDHPEKTWFLSDTHFGQERTLTFSRRPFRDTRDMDLNIISNWNKRIGKNDVVYFLGDWGEDAKYLKCLNFKTLNFVKGNYEVDKVPELVKDLKKVSNVNVYNNDECEIDINDNHYILRHEPISKKVPKDTYVIFGHIHEKMRCKRNGINVGIDGNNFAPFSQDDILFYTNALDKGYYDENVFCEECK